MYMTIFIQRNTLDVLKNICKFDKNPIYNYINDFLILFNVMNLSCAIYELPSYIYTMETRNFLIIYLMNTQNIKE